MGCVQVQNLEAQLEQSCVKKQLEALQRQLELLEVEKKEVEGQLEEAEKKSRELEDRGEPESPPRRKMFIMFTKCLENVEKESSTNNFI